MTRRSRFVARFLTPVGVLLLTVGLAAPIVRAQDSDDLLDQAATALDQGDPDSAIAAMNSALDDNPHDAVALYLGGRAYAQEGDSATAAQYFVSALAEDPEYAEARLSLANLYAGSPDLGDPVASLTELAATYPDDPALWTVLGSSEAQTGDVASAFDSTLTALSLNPGYAPAHLVLGSLFELSGQNDDALQEYLLIPELTSDDSIVGPARDRIAALSG
ncbi:MAG TPA: tetratricopeptide repeat protein [Chloroflexota bacterium]|jgi:tetratricopeptide (TPR) repeat protein